MNGFRITGSLLLVYTGTDPVVRVPEGTSRIARQAFAHNLTLEKVIFPEGLLEIGEEAFLGCSRLQKVVIPCGLEKVGDHAFSGCTALSTVDFPDTVNGMGDGVFARSGITSFRVPPLLPAVPQDMFLRCEKLKSVRISQGVQGIEPFAFAECPALTRVQFPSTLRVIQRGAFRRCDSLVRVKLPEGVEVIGNQAFGICLSLESVHLPASLRRADRGLAEKSPALKEIRVAPGNPIYRSRKGMLLDWESHSLEYVPGAMQGVCQVPEGVRNFSVTAFQDAVGVTEIRFPASIQAVPVLLLNQCPNLKLLCTEGDLKPWNRWIGFQYPEERKVPLVADHGTIGEADQRLRPMLLQGFLLRERNGSPVSPRARKAFLDWIRQHQKKLWKDNVCRDVILKYDLISLSSYSFCLDCLDPNREPEFIAALLEYRRRVWPNGEYEAYERERERKLLLEATRLEPTAAELRRIWICEKENGRLTLVGYRGSHTEPVIPGKIGRDRMAVIGSLAFCGGENWGMDGRGEVLFPRIRSIVVPEGVVAIRQNGLAGLSGLKSLTLPSTLQEIGPHALAGCVSLKTLTIPEHVLEITEDLIADCPSLQKVTFLGPTVVTPAADPDRTCRILYQDTGGYSPRPMHCKVVAPEGSLREWAESRHLPFQAVTPAGG